MKEQLHYCFPRPDSFQNRVSHPILAILYRLLIAVGLLSMEVNPETVYGGTNSNNYVTEIDVERCFSQNICVASGMTYTISLVASRRIDPITPVTTGFIISVTGLTTGTTYLSQITTRSNTTWDLSPETYTISIPAGSADKYIKLAFTDYVDPNTYGILLGDIEMHPQTDMSITSAGMSLNGAAIAVTNTPYTFTVANSPSQRSADGEHYESVASVSGQNNPVISSYSYADVNYTSPGYYRIVQVNSSGSANYSTVIILTQTIPSFAMTVYPSSAGGTLHYSVKVKKTAEAILEVVNATGQCIITGDTELYQGTNAGTLDISQLAGGLYFLRLVIPSNGVSAVKQFSKGF